MWVIPPSISSAFAREQLVSISAYLSRNPERGLGAMSSGKLTPRPYSWRGWRTRPWSRRLFGAATFGTSTRDASGAISVWLSRETRASPTASPETGREPTTSDGCSTGFSKSSTKAGLLLFSGKTSRGIPTGSSPSWSRHWKEWAAALRQEYSARRESAPATAGNDCSSWPTADTPSGGRVMPEGTTPTGRTPDGRKVTVGLENAAKMWPTARSEDSESSGERKSRGVADTLTAVSRQWTTPQAHDVAQGSPARVGRYGTKHGGRNLTDDVQAWPTPAATEARQGYQDRTRGKKGSQESLSTVAMKSHSTPPDPPTQDGQPSSQARRILNPLFVEWLQNWPIGWTDCDSAVTGVTRYKSRMRTELSRLCSRTPRQQSLL